jgi:hypothetical protein
MQTHTISLSLSHTHATQTHKACMNYFCRFRFRAFLLRQEGDVLQPVQ